MPHFSRLTDIVTCNLSAILAEAEDPQTTLEEIIREMEAGVAAAERSRTTAAQNEDRLRAEIALHQSEIERWVARAREHLERQDEEGARRCLVRKHEVSDLVAGLELQLKAAVATHQHLKTTYHALEARLADARRRFAAMQSGQPLDAEVETDAPEPDVTTTRGTSDIDFELEALRRDLGK